MWLYVRFCFIITRFNGLVGMPGAVHYTHLYSEITIDHPSWAVFAGDMQSTAFNVKTTNHQHLFRAGLYILYMLTKAPGGCVCVEEFESRRHVPTWIQARTDNLTLCICMCRMLPCRTHTRITYVYIIIMHWMNMDPTWANLTEALVKKNTCNVITCNY